MDPILEIAARHKLLVIEDVAQAHGAEYKGRRAGSMGDIGCFSFYPTKNLGAAGEGGMVTTNNSEYARTIGMLRNWGEEQRYYPVLKGYNYRLPAIQAAILRVKLPRLDQWIKARRGLAAEYDRLLEDACVVRHCLSGTSRCAARVLSIHDPGGGAEGVCKRIWRIQVSRARCTILYRFTLCLLMPMRGTRRAIFRLRRPVQVVF